MNENQQLSLRHLLEHITRLNSRYSDLLSIDKEFFIALDQMKLTAHGEIQPVFINKYEAFHQQIYVVISCLIRVLISFDYRIEKVQLPSRSCEEFLNYIKRKNEIHHLVTTLLSSIKYRADFIDHPQTKPLHDWITYTKGENKNNIIHFRHLKQKEEFSNVASLYSYLKVIKDFQIPMGEIGIGLVAPDYDEIYNAMWGLLSFFLDGVVDFPDKIQQS